MSTHVHITVPGKGDLLFDFVTEMIIADASIDSLTAQELTNAIRDAEDEPTALPFPPIAEITGKSNIGGTVSGIILELLGWKISTLKTTGYFTVEGGTVIESTDGPQIFGSTAGAFAVNIVDIGGVIAETGVSGLTAAESAKLLGLDTSACNVTQINGTAVTSPNDLKAKATIGL